MTDAPDLLCRKSAGFAPPRHAASLRRTLSIDVIWPDGRGAPGRYFGRGRDAWTDSAGKPNILAQAAFEASVTQDRRILALASDPPHPALAQLVGHRAGGGFRALVREALPEDFEQGSILHVLLDDLSGAALVSGWAWSLWDPGWKESLRASMTDPALRQAFPDRANICIGFAPGSSAFDPDTDRSGAPTTELVNPADPDGWHELPVFAGTSMRRARRMDVWEEKDIRIEAAFQDSATTPQGGRAVVHEYLLQLRADPATMEITEIEAQPKVLPFAECPGAAANARILVGVPLFALRNVVLEKLRGTAGCTHLNDALRALADAPALVKKLQQP